MAAGTWPVSPRVSHTKSAEPNDLRYEPDCDRDGIIERRRAAQRAWRTARGRMERAERNLKDALRTPSMPPAVAQARSCLRAAQREELTARSTYHAVAEKTGEMLSRIQHLMADR